MSLSASSICTATREPSGESRAAEYSRGGIALISSSRPLRSTHTSRRCAAVAPPVAYTNVPSRATSNSAVLVGRIKTFGTVAVDAMGPIPYAVLNGMLDGGFAAGAFNYWKSAFLPRLDDAASTRW